MPQLVLEYSSNIKEKDKLIDLFNNFHKVLTEMLPTSLTSCKS